MSMIADVFRAPEPSTSGERSRGATRRPWRPWKNDPSLAELSEAALIAACLKGQGGAFDLIVECHRRQVYQLCYRFVGNHDVFLRAYRGMRKFRGQSSIATWLYRIGVNVYLNWVSARTPPSERIDARQHIDTRNEFHDRWQR